MAGRSRDITVRFQGDEKDLRQSLDRVEQHTTKTGKNFAQVGTLIKTGFAAVAGSAVLDVVGDLDRLGMKMEATRRQADVVFGELADQAREWADEQNEAFGVGETALLGMAAAVQDLLVPMGFAREEAFAMTQEILTVSNALSEWKGGTIPAAQAQEILTKAILGERDGLVSLGVKISEADVQAHLAKKGQEDLTGATRQQAITQATLELITERSADALHAYTLRADSAIAKQKDLEAATADTAETWADLLRGPIEEGKRGLAAVADTAKFLSDGMANLKGETEKETEATDDMVEAWKITNPVGGLLWELLLKVGDAAKGAGESSRNAGTGLRFMADATKDDLIPALKEADQEQDDFREGQRELETQADRTTDAFRRQAEETRAMVDPVFNLGRRNRELAEAKQAVIDAETEFGVGSPQWQEATERLFLAQSNYNEASRIFAVNRGPAAREMFELIMTQAGLSADEINRAWEAYMRLYNAPRDLPVVTIVEGGKRVGAPKAHEGMVIPGPPSRQMAIVARGGEEIIPAHERANRHVAGAEITYNLNFLGPTYGMADLEDQIVRMLDRAVRRGRVNGSALGRG